MKALVIKARVAEELSQRLTRAHGVHSFRTHVHVSDTHEVRVLERASAIATLKAPSHDPEKESIKRELLELRAAMANTAKYLQQMNIQQAPSVSYLDEVLAALSARRDELPVAKLPQSFIDSLSSDDI